MGAGGSKGKVAPQAVAPITTTSSIGNKLSAQGSTFNEGAVDKEKSVDKKKLGTRGLQIPMAATQSNTKSTPATTGVQL